MDGMNGYTTGMPGNGMNEDRWQQMEREQELQRARARELKQARSHFSKLGGMYMLGTVVIFAVQLIPTMVLKVLGQYWIVDSDVAMMISMLPMYLVGMPVLIVLVRTIPGDRVERRHMKAWQFLLAAIMCFALVYITNIAGLAVTSIIGMLKGGRVQNQIQAVTESVSLWSIALYMVICAPFMEEYVFRKLIVDRTIRYGQGTAVLMSGLMFGLFHGNLNQFVYAFALGSFLAFLYVKTGKLKVTIALHMMINFMGGLVSSLLTRVVDLDGYVEALESGTEAMMAYMAENMRGLAAYGLFMLFVVGCMIAGLVLFIVCLAKRKFTFEKGPVTIPKGKRFSTMFLNLGMILYGIFWIVMIIIQLFA